MSRLLCALFVALYCAVSWSAAADHESPSHRDLLTDTPHPLDRKDAARAKFEAMQTPAKDLAQAKLAASEFSFSSRLREFLAGRGTLDFLLESFLQHAVAGSALAQDAGEQATVNETLWIQACIPEQINAFRYRAGRIPTQDYAQSVAFRFEAQLALRRTWAPLVQKATRAGWYHYHDGIEYDAPWMPVGQKELAKEKFDATQIDNRELIARMLEATREQEAARFKEFHCGRGTLDFLLESNVHLAQARLLFSDQPAERLASFESLWIACRAIERVNLFRYQSGRIPSQDYAVSRYYRGHTGILLRDERKRFDQAKVGNPLVSSDLPWHFYREEPNYLKFFARDKRRLFQAGQQDLEQARMHAAREECDDRGKNFFDGRGTLDFLIGSTLRLLDSELPVAESQAEQLLALHRHWLRTYSIEQTNQYREKAGRIPTKDYMDSLYHRIDAELWLKQFLADKKLPLATPLRFRLEPRGCP